MFAKYKTLNVILALVVSLTFTLFVQPCAAKTVQSVLDLNQKSEQQLALLDSAYTLSVEISLEYEVVNLDLLVQKVLSVDGVTELRAKKTDRKRFLIVFDPRVISYEDLTYLLDLLVDDEQLY